MEINNYLQQNQKVNWESGLYSSLELIVTANIITNTDFYKTISKGQM